MKNKYYCSKCKQIYVFEGTKAKWFKSYCERTGQDARFIKIEEKTNISPKTKNTRTNTGTKKLINKYRNIIKKVATILTVALIATTTVVIVFLALYAMHHVVSFELLNK